MVATREKQHRDRIPEIKTQGFDLLPLAIIFGANASGKSNFFGAIQIARELVVSARPRPEDTINIQHFRLSGVGKEKPSTFDFTVLCQERLFRYRFAVNFKEIVDESLHEVLGAREELIFGRGRIANSEGSDWDLSGFRKVLSAEQLNFVDFKSRDTQRNQLFLNSARGKDIKEIDLVAEWFVQLTLISPNTVFKPAETSLSAAEGLKDYCNRALEAADTGVAKIETEEVKRDSLPLPAPMIDHLEILLAEGNSALVPAPNGERFALTKEKGQVKAFRLVAYHKNGDREPVRFEFSSESEGTRRLVDLLPAFHELAWSGKNKVFIIDELDRSLHTHLTWKLIESFILTLRAESRCQLILTTHDIMLLDQNLIRRDEIWFVEKHDAGDSRLTSLGEYKDIRYDKDIRKSYLAGRFGGVPRVLLLPNRQVEQRAVKVRTE